MVYQPRLFLVCHLNNPRGSALGLHRRQGSAHTIAWLKRKHRQMMPQITFQQEILLLKRFYFIFHWISFSFKLRSFSITESISHTVQHPVKVCSPEAAAEMWRVTFLENVVEVLECYQAVCNRVISQSAIVETSAGMCLTVEWMCLE